MLYSILIFGDGETFGQLSDAEQDAAMVKHTGLQKSLSDANIMGPVARLHNSSTAVTVRAQDGVAMVTDGPFAETKEQLLGFYTMECASMEEAIEIAKQLPLGIATLEIRPVEWFHGGVLSPAANGE